MAQLPSVHIKLIVLQLLVAILFPVWFLKLTHYFMMPLPFFFSSQSTIPTSDQQALKSLDEVDWTKTLLNILLFGVFFLQHYLMAAFKWKIASSKLWPMYPAYERLFYNIISSWLLITILEYQQTNTYVLFTLPFWLCLPLALIGFSLFVNANLQMERSIFLPYYWSELFSDKQVKLNQNDYQKKQQTGISIKGAYNFIRHPMQSGILFEITFGSNIFTFEKVVLVSIMAVFIFVGVKMEEGRLIKKFKQYSSYMNVVQYRFIPYVF